MTAIVRDRNPDSMITSLLDGDFSGNDGAVVIDATNEHPRLVLVHKCFASLLNAIVDVSLCTCALQNVCNNVEN